MFIAITLHLLATIIWVGGMFFAYMILRPSAAELLEPPQRLALWCTCFGRFFFWVWICVVTLPVSGYWMVFELYGGFSNSGWHIRTMHLSGLLMIGLYLYLFMRPYHAIKQQIASKDYPGAAKSLARIRTIIGTNLIIGLVTATIASTGRFI